MGLGPSPTAIERGACPGFVKWARPDLIEGLELVFATPSWAEPATTAGHVLLRARARADTAELVPATEPVWSYGVDMTRPEAARHRFVRGLIGDLRGEVLTETGEAGLWLEVIAPFGGAAHHLRVQARLAPGIGTDRTAIESEASARLDLLASRRHGVFLGPFTRWTRGGLRGDGWEAGAGVGF